MMEIISSRFNNCSKYRCFKQSKQFMLLFLHLKSRIVTIYEANLSFIGTHPYDVISTYLIHKKIQSNNLILLKSNK